MDDDVDLGLDDQLKSEGAKNWHELHVDIYHLKNTDLECDKIYEFLGEIEQNHNHGGLIYLKCRVIKKDANKYDRLNVQGKNSTYEIYKHQSANINNLIESLLNRGKQNSKADQTQSKTVNTTE